MAYSSVLNFDWQVLHETEITTREVCNVKKEQNQKRDCSRLQTRQQQKSDDIYGTSVDKLTKSLGDPIQLAC